MKLNWVQHKRFNECIDDLAFLVDRVNYYFPKRSLEMREVIDLMKRGEFNKYQRTLIKRDVFLNLKVDRAGRIRAYLILLDEKSRNSIAHRNINWFIDQSSLSDPEVEYVFE